MSTTAFRPHTPGRVAPSAEALPAITENGNQPTSRRTSLGFLRRSRSTEPIGERKTSGSKKKKAQMEEEIRRQREAMPKHAPVLPDLSPAPKIETFGGEERPESADAFPGESTPLRSPPSTSPMDDIYARTESMTHRGRYSYASSAVSTINSPRRLRRRKDPTPYNVLVIGARNSGKTSFLNFLKKSLALPPHKRPIRTPDELEELERQPAGSDGYTCHYLETEIDSERVGLTLWDSQGLERSIVDIQMRGVTGFLESKFEDTLTEEMKVIRSPGARDTHIHCTFLILDPVRLDENRAVAERFANGTQKATDSPVVGILDKSLDIQVLQTVLGKTTVVPIISKADTITTAHMAYLRKAVWDSLKMANIDPLEILTLEEQEEDLSETDEEEAKTDPSSVEESDKASEEKPPSPSKDSRGSGSQAANQNLPFAILSPDPHALASGDEPIGRKFPWGFADPYNPEHCDFVRLKESVFSDWRSELREASRVIWYERWRTNRLHRHDNHVQVPEKKVYSGRMAPGAVADGRRTR
ncbi:Septin [Aspergillus sclerotialis]|uniref:Septin n=1 Tax=Aspergillus sclerotialis TaxID=2070753 RepID=A0A3A2Z9T7_9EURO|nr:Septin [Aspergillus sclerotialis]